MSVWNICVTKQIGQCHSDCTDAPRMACKIGHELYNILSSILHVATFIYRYIYMSVNSLLLLRLQAMLCARQTP